MPSKDPVTLLIQNPFILMFLAGVLVIFACKKMEYLIGMFCASSHLLGAVNFGPVPSLQLLYILMAMGMGISVWKNKGVISFLLNDKPNILILIFGLVLLFNLFLVSTDFDFAKNTFKYFCVLSILPYLLLQVSAPTYEHLKGFLSAYTVVCLVVGIFLVVGFDSRTVEDPGRVSLVVNPITFSAPFSISAIFVLYLLLETKRSLYRTSIWFLLFGTVLIVFLSGTRQSLFPMFLCTALFLYLRSSRRVLIYYVMTICLVAIVYASIDLTGGDPIKNRFSAAFSDPLTQMEGRIETYSMAIRDFATSPVIGIGLGSFGEYEAYDELATKTHVHNLYLEILAEEGLIGFLLYGCFLYEIFRRGIAVIKNGAPKLRSLGIAFFCVFLLSIIQGMVGGSIGGATNILWCSSGLIILHRNISRHGPGDSLVTRSHGDMCYSLKI